MNLLFIHNFYQHPGGEDQVCAAEVALMESKGHRVWRYSVHNDAVTGMSRVRLAGRLIWNGVAYREIRALIRRERIDLVHCHNTFPLISPAAYFAARAEGARVVQTLHNYRLVCPGSLLYRQGRVCEDCIGKAIPWRGAMHSCYRNSAVESAGAGAMVAFHRMAGTWNRQVDAYIALSDFARTRFIEGGLPAARIAVKPNFVYPDPGAGSGDGGYALFAGRLSPDKGIDVLLRAWRELGGVIRLKIAGDGPSAQAVRRACENSPGIEYLGHQRREEILALMRHASFLVFPSLWYEGFPMTIAEAYASGLPVVATDLGSMTSIVKEGVTGLRFAPGDINGLISRVRWLRSHPERLRELRQNARDEFSQCYSAKENYAQTIRIYEGALRRRADVHPVTEAA